MTSPTCFEKRQIAETLLKKEETIHHLLDAICDLVSVWDASGQLIFTSSKNSKLTVPEHTQAFFASVHEGFRLEIAKKFRKVTQSRKPCTLQYQYRDVDGGWMWLESTGIPLIDESGKTTYVLVASKDVTKQKKTEESLKSLAFHDPLTGLPNRRLFKEHFTHAITYAKRNRNLIALLYLDIDDFKVINDTMGHEIGDDFLKAFAKRVKACIREIDTFARMGGDEFTLLLTAVDSIGSVEKVVNRIFTSLSAPWELKQHRFTATVSAGVVVYPSNGEDPATLYRHADIALYQAKGTGRNTYKFYTTG